MVNMRLGNIAVIILISTQTFAQVDTSKALVNIHWTLVKVAEQKFLERTINFCSLNQIKSKDPKTTKDLFDKSYSFLYFLNTTTSLDSSIAAKIDSLNYSLLNSLVTFFEKLQKDKILFSQPGIRQEGKMVEYEIENIRKQIHDFNYWINEKNNIKIKFKDINL